MQAISFLFFTCFRSKMQSKNVPYLSECSRNTKVFPDMCRFKDIFWIFVGHQSPKHSFPRSLPSPSNCRGLLLPLPLSPHPSEPVGTERELSFYVCRESRPFSISASCLSGLGGGGTFGRACAWFGPMEKKRGHLPPPRQLVILMNGPDISSSGGFPDSVFASLHSYTQFVGHVSFWSICWKSIIPTFSLVELPHEGLFGHLGGETDAVTGLFRVLLVNGREKPFR